MGVLKKIDPATDKILSGFISQIGAGGDVKKASAGIRRLVSNSGGKRTFTKKERLAFKKGTRSGFKKGQRSGYRKGKRSGFQSASMQNLQRAVYGRRRY